MRAASGVSARSASGEDVDGVEVRTAVGDNEWDAFVNGARGHYAQTSMWAELKATVGWTAERLVVCRGREILGGVQLLSRDVPLIGRAAVVPSGPVVSDSEQNVVNIILHELVTLCARRRIGWLKVQPFGADQLAIAHVERLLRGLSFVKSDLGVGPAAITRVDLDADLQDVMGSLRKNLRSDIRRAQRKGVSVREGGERDLATFADLVEHTAVRQRQGGMVAFPPAYYAQTWQSFVRRGRGCLLLGERAGRALCGVMLVTYGDTCEWLYGGWTGDRSDLHPNKLVQWSAIEWAHQRGFRWYDLGQIDPLIAHRIAAGERVPTDAATGYTRYKLGFNGQVIVRPPAYDHTGRRLLRPAVRLLSPRLHSVGGLVNRVRGVMG